MKIRNELAHTRLDLERAIKSGVGVSKKLMDDAFSFLLVNSVSDMLLLDKIL